MSSQVCAWDLSFLPNTTRRLLGVTRRPYLLFHALAAIPFTVSKNLVNLKVFFQFKVACRVQPPQGSSGVIWGLPSLMRS